MTNHTSGPWRVETWDYSLATPPRKELNIQNERMLIATCQCDHDGDNPYVIPKGDAEANARIMAAAPELLAACKAARMTCDGANPAHEAIYNQLSEAIAKAEGRE